MHCLDLSFPHPEENLACDEALLDWAEAGRGTAVLRFWEAPTYFAVLGYANRLSTELDEPECARQRVPVFRRCTGGGTVLQGPGCLNYSLICRIASEPELSDVTRTNRFMLARIAAALQPFCALPVRVDGYTDLTVGGLKFSGNAQRRRRDWLLFHGSILLQFNLGLIERLLPVPARQPEYRRNRSHRDFLTNLNLPAAEVKAALVAAWNASDSLVEIPLAEIRTLARGKYRSDDWIRKFV